MRCSSTWLATRRRRRRLRSPPICSQCIRTHRRNCAWKWRRCSPNATSVIAFTQPILLLFQGEPTYDAIISCVYLDAVINEALRLYPPAIRLEWAKGNFLSLFLSTDRHCNKDCIIDGIELKEGDWIQMSVWSLHHSDKYWHEPYEFRPERCEEILCASTTTQFADFCRRTRIISYHTHGCRNSVHEVAR